MGSNRRITSTSLSSRIIEYLVKHGQTQADIARMLGVSQGNPNGIGGGYQEVRCPAGIAVASPGIDGETELSRDGYAKPTDHCRLPHCHRLILPPQSPIPHRHDDRLG